MPRLLLGLVLLAPVLALGAGEPETVGRVRTLPDRPGPHWFWLSDVVLHRTALFDADSGDLLGQISSGSAGVGFVIVPLFSPDHREILEGDILSWLERQLGGPNGRGGGACTVAPW